MKQILCKLIVFCCHSSDTCILLFSIGPHHIVNAYKIENTIFTFFHIRCLFLLHILIVMHVVMDVFPHEPFPLQNLEINYPSHFENVNCITLNAEKKLIALKCNQAFHDCAMTQNFHKCCNWLLAITDKLYNNGLVLFQESCVSRNSTIFCTFSKEYLCS